MQLTVNDQVHLSEFQSSDKPALIEHLNERQIYEHTLQIPFPYTQDDARRWIALVGAETEHNQQPVQFAIRNENEQLIGSCGFNDLQLGASHRGEIGYWLARPYWGQGIMTAVVRRACEHAFASWKLLRITAHVFDFNVASVRVLEKVGFEQEGVLRKHLQKDGRYLDAVVYGLLKGSVV